MDETEQADAEYYLARQMGLVNQSLGHNTCIQLLMVLVALSIMLSICTAMSKRERERAARRVLAEESRRARSTFLSNMSHDIRAPMNAIIGYINLAERKENDLETVRGYLKKIKASSHHLLALINAEPAEQRVQVHAAGRRDLRHAPADRRRGGRLVMSCASRTAASA